MHKDELRTSLLAARRAMPADTRVASRAAICEQLLDRARRERWPCVAAYEPMPTEPGSPELLAGLVGLGVRVLVPATLPDRDLDWAQWSPAGRSEPLGVDAIVEAVAVLVPALAVSRDGTRLGRGGGSYDRALLRAHADAARIALLFDGELVAGVPHEPWDQPVTAVVSPSGWTDLGVGGPD